MHTPDMPTPEKDGLHPTVCEFWRAYILALNYVTPFWEQYARLYEFFRNKRFDALNATYSKIMIAYGYAAVADRMAKMYQNFAGGWDKVSVIPNTPEAELSAEAAETWLKNKLSNDFKIDSAIPTTLQGALFGGTAYRVVHMEMRKTSDGTFKRALCGKDVDFYHVLPCPGGGHVNPYDAHQTNAVPWVIVIDWMTEDKIQANKEAGYFNKEAVEKMLDNKPQTKSVYLEDPWRDRLAVIGNLSYNGPSSWRLLQNTVQDNSRRRRIAHWYRRDKHIIVGEDAFLLRDGPPDFADGTIPLVKYVVCPDLSNWFGIPYLSLLEDVLKASIMGVNYRHDHLLASMFPTTWIRRDIADAAKLTRAELRPKPYDVQFFPREVQDIQKAIWYDRRAEIPPHAFIEEDRMKAIIQKIGGQTETTGSFGNVVGNKTAGGVNAIMGELQARPNMESMIFEYTGFREECLLALAYGANFFTEREQVRVKSEDGFPWRTIAPYDLAQDYTVLTHGARYLAERDQNFQKLLAFYPYWNQSPIWNNYELNKQVAEATGVLPNYERALVDPQSQNTMKEAAEIGQPGGAASSQDIMQQITSQGNSTSPSGKRNKIGAY
jgi:hypothetical protein